MFMVMERALTLSGEHVMQHAGDTLQKARFLTGSKRLMKKKEKAFEEDAIFAKNIPISFF